VLGNGSLAEYLTVALAKTKARFAMRVVTPGKAGITGSPLYTSPITSYTPGRAIDGPCSQAPHPPILQGQTKRVATPMTRAVIDKRHPEYHSPTTDLKQQPCDKCGAINAISRYTLSNAIARGLTNEGLELVLTPGGRGRPYAMLLPLIRLLRSKGIRVKDYR
jgi:hypothetical protein